MRFLFGDYFLVKDRETSEVAAEKLFGDRRKGNLRTVSDFFKMLLDLKSILLILILICINLSYMYV